jgi:methylenetetrahydrofolate dehydrogenase (NADP+)/methenyltetrahydrofolate cyclohydrolase
MDAVPSVKNTTLGDMRMTKRLEGKPVADKIYTRIRELIDHNLDRKGRPPHLVIFYSIDVEESRIYVGRKIKACEELGIKCTAIALDKEDSYEEVRLKVIKESRRGDVDGVIIQLPLHLELPKWKLDELIDCIHPDKDVDGLTTSSAGLIYKGKNIKWRIPATVRAILNIIEHYEIPTDGQSVTILGRSELVGKPLAAILSSPEWNAVVTLCHSKGARHISDYLWMSDIVISAVGKPHLISEPEYMRSTFVIDAGITKTDDGIKGDAVWSPLAYGQTPVPGGVGPVTVACLLENVVLRWSYSNGL